MNTFVGPSPAAASAGVGRERTFLAVSALIFIASAAATISWCRSMSGGMPMPGGWAMSMAWMKMPGQTWPGAASAFLAMWTVMMLAMMLPSLVPALSSYRRSMGGLEERRVARLTLLSGLGHFFVWLLFGAAVYPLGALAAAAEMRSPALAKSVPIATGIALLLAGAVQLTGWKARLLRQCRDAPCDPTRRGNAGAAWRHGLRLGARCALCCIGFMTILIVVGVMNLATMAAVTAAITVERLAPNPERAARAAGILTLAAGAVVVLQSFRPV
jgi:predicted metal-binding membrane protein